MKRADFYDDEVDGIIDFIRSHPQEWMNHFKTERRSAGEARNLYGRILHRLEYAQEIDWSTVPPPDL